MQHYVNFFFTTECKIQTHILNKRLGIHNLEDLLNLLRTVKVKTASGKDHDEDENGEDNSTQ